MHQIIPNTQQIHLSDAAGRIVKVIAWETHGGPLTPIVWNEFSNLAEPFRHGATYTKEPTPVDISWTNRSGG